MPTQAAGQAGATGGIILWLSLAVIIGAIVIALLSSPSVRNRMTSVLAGNHPDDADEAKSGTAATATEESNDKVAAAPYPGFDPDMIYGAVTTDDP